MTTLELANILVDSSRIGDLGAASPSQKARLALVITQAVQQYFALAPTCHRRTTLSDYRHAEETVTVTVTNGSPTVSGTPFLARQRGCSLLFPDGSWNEITGPSSMLHETSQASGTYTCTVLNDALAFDDFQINRVLTDPEIETSGGSSWLLRPWKTDGARATARPTLSDLLCPDARTINRRHDTAAWPTHYWSEHIGGSIASSTDALFQIRFWPAPREAYHVTFDGEILPDTYRLADVNSPRTLPVPDGHAQNLLVPLAEGRLARSPLFDPDKANYNSLMAAYEEARAGIAALPSSFGPIYQFIGTEPGW